MKFLAPQEFAKQVKEAWKPQWKAVFCAVILAGLLIHMPVLLSDIPNHDGLDSMYFDQNMITSGRWFLMIACGISSFYSLPWLIGILGILYLAVAGVVLVQILEVEDSICAALIGMLLVSFPALASTFAYVFTLDGYMMGLLFSVLSVWCVKRFKKGFFAGAVCLAFSMGIYQAYLPFAMLLSMFEIVRIFAGKEPSGHEKGKAAFGYLFMGIMGIGLYELVLHILLKVEGKQLDTYQGINEMSHVLSIGDIPARFAAACRDFFAFTLKGRILYNNPFSGAAFWLLAGLVLVTGFFWVIGKKWWKKPQFFIIMILVLLCVPAVTDLILIVSPDVNFHLLMRYQWVLFPVFALAFLERTKVKRGMQWLAVLSAAVLIFCNTVTDNIAYNNLNKKYEKTYAYCLRLLDRIEQTDGYYQGIPVAMIGKVGDEQYPETDITKAVTDAMIGMSGDYLLYTGLNYEKFMKYYLGASLNFVPTKKLSEIYYREEYVEMESFPGKTSVRIIDGILCVKTENVNRD